MLNLHKSDELVKTELDQHLDGRLIWRRTVLFCLSERQYNSTVSVIYFCYPACHFGDVKDLLSFLRCAKYPLIFNEGIIVQMSRFLESSGV